jgi:O-antigen/teichoic acid export membrane protein
MFSTLVLARYFLLETPPLSLLRHATLGQLKHHAKLYRNFPRYTMAADGIAVVTQRFAPVLVLAWFSPAIAGLYAFSVRAVRMPLLMVAHPVVGALRKEAMDRVHAGQSLFPLFLTTLRGLLAVSVVPFVILALFSEPIFVFVFGPQWAGAGQVVEILSPGILLEFIAIPTAVFFLVTDTQHLTFAVQLAGFAALVAAVAIGRYLFDDFITTCYLLSVAMVIANGAALWLAGSVSKRPTPTTSRTSGEAASVAASW